MSVFWGEGHSLNTLWKWSRASRGDKSSFGRLSDMRQGLERVGGGGLGWSFHQNIPDCLTLWISVAGVELPPEHLRLFVYMDARGWGVLPPEHLVYRIGCRQKKNLNSFRTKSGFFPSHPGVGSSLLYHNTSPTPRVPVITAGGNETRSQHYHRNLLEWLQGRGVFKSSQSLAQDVTHQAVDRAPSQLSLCFYFFMEILGS